MQEKIFDLILEQEEVGWKTILYDLVRTEQMDPWDVDISLLTKKYLDAVKKMQEHDLRISGKIVLAAAILLKIKSSHLLEYGITNLDKLINLNEDLSDDELMGELGEEMARQRREQQKYQLIPRNPQARNRKVSIHDLVNALQRALESKRKILAKQMPVKYEMPKRRMDILEVIYDLYHKIVYYTNKEKSEELTFTKLLPPRPTKMDKVYTFIPLLHLENQRKVETAQSQPFEEIQVRLLKKKAEA